LLRRDRKSIPEGTISYKHKRHKKPGQLRTGRFWQAGAGRHGSEPPTYRTPPMPWSAVAARCPAWPAPVRSAAARRHCGTSLSRGGCQNRRHSLLNCDHGDSIATRFDSRPRAQRLPGAQRLRQACRAVSVLSRYFVKRTSVTQGNLSQYGPVPRWKRPAHRAPPPRACAAARCTAALGGADAPLRTSTPVTPLLDKNRRWIGKSQSKRPPRL
jgi:hypothetical protein